MPPDNNDIGHDDSPESTASGTSLPPREPRLTKGSGIGNAARAIEQMEAKRGKSNAGKTRDRAGAADRDDDEGDERPRRRDNKTPAKKSSQQEPRQGKRRAAEEPDDDFDDEDDDNLNGEDDDDLDDDGDDFGDEDDADDDAEDDDPRDRRKKPARKARRDDNGEADDTADDNDSEQDGEGDEADDDTAEDDEQAKNDRKRKGLSRLDRLAQAYALDDGQDDSDSPASGSQRRDGARESARQDRQNQSAGGKSPPSDGDPFAVFDEPLIAEDALANMEKDDEDAKPFVEALRAANKRSAAGGKIIRELARVVMHQTQQYGMQLQHEASTFFREKRKAGFNAEYGGNRGGKRQEGIIRHAVAIHSDAAKHGEYLSFKQALEVAHRSVFAKRENRNAREEGRREVLGKLQKRKQQMDPKPSGSTGGELDARFAMDGGLNQAARAMEKHARSRGISLG